MKNFNIDFVPIKDEQLNEHLELENTGSKINKSLDGVKSSLDSAEVRISECRNRATENYIANHICTMELES